MHTSFRVYTLGLHRQKSIGLLRHRLLLYNIESTVVCAWVQWWLTGRFIRDISNSTYSSRHASNLTFMVIILPYAGCSGHSGRRSHTEGHFIRWCFDFFFFWPAYSRFCWDHIFHFQLFHLWLVLQNTVFLLYRVLFYSISHRRAPWHHC